MALLKIIFHIYSMYKYQCIIFIQFFYDYIGILGNYPYYDPSSGVNISVPNIHMDNLNAPGSSTQQQFDVYRPGREQLYFIFILKKSSKIWIVNSLNTF